MKAFSYSHDFANTDFRKEPGKYRIGRGEEGVLLCRPFTTEIEPFWKFKTPEIAQQSANKIHALYEDYKRKKEFVGMDMCRKFLQMGVTRSKRYYWHRGGHKYDGPVPAANKGQSGAHGRAILPDSKDKDESKLASAHIFEAKLKEVLSDPDYIQAKAAFEAKYP